MGLSQSCPNAELQKKKNNFYPMLFKGKMENHEQTPPNIKLRTSLQTNFFLNCPLSCQPNFCKKKKKEVT